MEGKATTAITKLEKYCMEHNAQAARQGARSVMLGVGVAEVPWKGENAPELPAGLEPYDALADPGVDPKDYDNPTFKYARGMNVQPHLTVALADKESKALVEEFREVCRDHRVLLFEEIEIAGIKVFPPRAEVAKLGHKGAAIVASVKPSARLWAVYNLAHSVIPTRSPCFGDVDAPRAAWSPHVTIGYFHVDKAKIAQDWALQFVGQKLLLGGMEE